jgi:hypothetical protein
MRDDLRLALRALRKEPGFAAVAVLTLALGIGVNTSLFSLVSAFFLQPLSVDDPQDLVVVMQRGPHQRPYGHSPSTTSTSGREPRPSRISRPTCRRPSI